MEYKVGQLLKNKMIPAALSIVLGIVIIIARRAAVDLLVKIIGGVLIAAAILLVLIYPKRKGTDKGNLSMTLILAVPTALIGILLYFFAENIVDIFPIIIGVYLILNGLNDLTAAYVYQGTRKSVGLTGILVMILGLLIVIRPDFLINFLMVFIGASMIVNGLTDLLVLKKINGELA